MAKIQGSDMMLFLNDVSIAYATNHTLSIQAETADTSNKDEGGGDWASNEVKILSWSATSENLYSVDGQGKNFADLYDIMVSKTPVEAIFAKKSQNVVDVPTGGWTSSVPKYKGKVVITKLDLNAPNGDYATFSAEFQGVGALQKITE